MLTHETPGTVDSQCQYHRTSEETYHAEVLGSIVRRPGAHATFEGVATGTSTAMEKTQRQSCHISERLTIRETASTEYTIAVSSF